MFFEISKKKVSEKMFNLKQTKGAIANNTNPNKSIGNENLRRKTIGKKRVGCFFQN